MRDSHGELIQLEVGMILYGYCGGAFGRDSYENKRVEAIGMDWLVARGVDSGRVFFTDVEYGGWPSRLNQLLEFTTKGE